MARRLWINTGELSGDMQAASVAVALRGLEPDCELVGMGGGYLAEAGQRNVFDVSALSVMGGVEIVTAIPRALTLLGRIRIALTELRPDAVVLVDAPEFHFRVARIAYDLGIPTYYFIPPKVWAWRTGRVEFLRRYVRRMFCILPFEVPFYRRYGIDVEYVGNPLIDRIHAADIGDVIVDPNLIGLLPGSRMKEVAVLLPVFCEAARLVADAHPGVRFVCLCAPNMDADRMRALIPDGIGIDLVKGGNPYRFIRSCSMIVAASGTAVLETALCGTPTVIAYKLAKISELIVRRLIKVRHVGLPNLIMDDDVFPELLQDDCTAGNIASVLCRWRRDGDALARVRQRMRDVAVRCGGPGSAMRCAKALLAAMDGDRA